MLGWVANPAVQQLVLASAGVHSTSIVIFITATLFTREIPLPRLIRVVDQIAELTKSHKYSSGTLRDAHPDVRLLGVHSSSSLLGNIFS
jgi:hypothetical protein